MQLEDPVLTRSFRGHNDAVTSTVFHTNMTQLVSGSLDGIVMIWNFKPQMRALRFLGHKVGKKTLCKQEKGPMNILTCLQIPHYST